MNPAKSNVQPINPTPQAIALPESWQLQTSFGYMGFNATTAGRLVRLADVLWWLQTSRALPRTEALGALCAAMPADIMQWLYEVHPRKFAAPVSPMHAFGYKTAQQLENDQAAQYFSALQNARPSRGGTGRFGESGAHMAGGKISFSKPEATEPGLPALLKLLRAWWWQTNRTRQSQCDILNDPTTGILATLAVPLDKAASAWGWGQVPSPVQASPANFSELVAYRKANKGSAWTAPMVGILKSEKEAREGQPGARRGIATELGCSVTFIGQLLAPERQPKRQTTGVRKSATG